MRNIIGPRVKLARHLTSRKITQSDLAVRLQLSGWTIDRSGVAKIEAGLREVSDIEVMCLAKTLGVSASWLLGENNAAD